MKTFREMEYVRPDFAELEKVLREKIAKMNAAKTADEAITAYQEFEQADMEAATMASIAHIRNTIDTTDDFYDTEAKAVQAGTSRLTPVYREANEALLKSPFRAEMEERFGKYLFHNLSEQTRLLDPAIIEDKIQENELVSAYQKATAVCHTEFRGEDCNFYGLLKHMQSTDREERREALTAWAAMYEGVADEIGNIYRELVRLRVSMAKKLGFDSYTDMAYLSRRRYCYGPKEAAVFREQVRTIITPAVAELYEKQRKRLGIEHLEYCDEELIFPEGNEDPFGTKDEMVAAAQKMYRELSPETGEFFDFMVKYDLFDLESKPGKRMGGYCTRLPAYKAPFIFSNFNGTAADAEVLTHEAGHAFQGYLSARTLPLSAIQHSTSEINEIHSMSMEYFTYPWMELFFHNADKYRFAHLWGTLKVIPYMVTVDEFQHRVFEDPEMPVSRYKEIWHELEQKYMPWRSYDGNAFLEAGNFWMQKQHIFMYPFYYIDYALAAMGAFDFLSRNLKDHDEAWQGYLHLCRLGGSMEYFELLDEAQLHNPMKPGSVQEIISGVLAQLNKAEY